MNRLVIVGNGFDLAHGMKTGYNDFLIWYIINSYELAYNNSDGIYEDGALKIVADKRRKVKIINHHGIPAFVNYFYQKGELGRMMTLTTFEDGKYMWDQNPFTTTIKSEFIVQLISKCSISNWVDIENEYYQSLKESDKLESYSDVAVSMLNQSLAQIVFQLQSYLSSLPTAAFDARYTQILSSNINSRDIIGLNPNYEFQAEHTMILNFNYTATVEQYITDSQTEINYIHGKLNEDDNPLVFGFGDELDEEYFKFENTNTKGVFEHIKSFWYFRTRNYHNLIRFIRAQEYQVVILGHSCGLSDRTMLNMIFEDRNCHSIKIYHHEYSNTNNYTNLTYEIARHFRNKREMREKIVPFDKSSYMPQII
ncbi:AbiH family protein [Pedobacter duraquae]|uniref:Abortive infection AbiH-like protein n=1 Tax=Pedobacter duraquae TaxID=425511 RepID=A0A4R6IHE3_9SPHI|nr:AbiH family protein [Pedobacter duraquae]TDO21328.1 abortive infection AbiH-like protein [Pedobacter duraquae]